MLHFGVNVAFWSECYISGVNVTYFSGRDYIFTMGQFFDHMTRSQKLSRSKTCSLNPPDPLQNVTFASQNVTFASQNVNIHLSKC